MFAKLTQRSALVLRAPRMLNVVACRSYYKDNVLMTREQGEYYADPMDVAERVVRIVGLHDACKDPGAVTLSATFS
mgnify:CR=1 FL=1